MGWIGVDLDGTLAEYHGWVSETHIGEPIPAMAERVRYWLAHGTEVRIFTARVYSGVTIEGDRARLSPEEITRHIQDWTEKHFGVRLPVTNVKDFGMVELWDDRAVRVVANKGEPCCGGEPGDPPPPADQIEAAQTAVHNATAAAQAGYLLMIWTKDDQNKVNNVLWSHNFPSLAEATKQLQPTINELLRQEHQAAVRDRPVLLGPNGRPIGFPYSKPRT